MMRQQAFWTLVSLFSFVCIATNQPFVFFEDGTILYAVSMIIGVVCTSTSEHAPSKDA